MMALLLPAQIGQHLRRVLNLDPTHRLSYCAVEDKLLYRHNAVDRYSC